MDSERKKDNFRLVFYSFFMSLIGYGIYWLVGNRKSIHNRITFVFYLFFLTAISYFAENLINTCSENPNLKTQTPKEDDCFLIKNCNLCFEYLNHFMELIIVEL